MFKQYFKQAREELTLRLCDRLYKDGKKDKWWQVRLRSQRDEKSGLIL
jgi:hypothetical protein